MDGNDQALYILTAGRSPSWPEREYWQRVLSSHRRLCVWLMVLLTLFFGYNGACVALYTDDWAQALTTVLLMVIAGAALLWFILSWQHRARSAMQTAWYDEQADKKRLAAGCTVAFYGDRVVRTDLRGAVTLPYSRITSCTESLHGFYLMAGSTAILVRSGDLTAQQAALIGEHLRERLDPAVFHMKGRVVACLTEPLPIPCFDNDDPVLTRAAVTLRQPWLTSARRQTEQAVLRGFVMPAMLIYGTAFANAADLTGSFFVDLALCCGAAVVGSVLILRLLTAFGKRRVRLSLAFTRDGLAGFAEGCSYFTARERLVLIEEKRGMRVQFPDGNSLRIPWSCIEDAEQVKQRR